ncbi:hypothetical protein [Methylobacterium sp. WCS2018Hpa-22]|uniref:hypothetical protein n=1 Tax=Methylobacterium sp. WCS2018Hpa-22 TaxID=3073633 RepID=UPI00288A2B6C|nr:hypothetical protein [Methylobacterium sp. WCS2018Hpa-22]
MTNGAAGLELHALKTSNSKSSKAFAVDDYFLYVPYNNCAKRTRRTKLSLAPTLVERLSMHLLMSIKLFNKDAQTLDKHSDNAAHQHGGRAKAIIETLTFIIIGASFLISLYQTKKISESLDTSNRAINGTIWAAIVTQSLEVNKVFIAEPHMQKYFYSNVDINDADVNFEKASAIATLMIDYFAAVMDFYSEDVDTTPQNEVTRINWRKSFVGIFKRSPLLCRHYDANSAYFAEMIREISKEGCKK